MFWKPFDLQKLDTHSDKCTRCGNTLHAKGFQCPARKFQCKVCHKFGHFTTVCYQKSQQSSSLFKSRKPKAQQLQAGALYTHHNTDRSGSELLDAEESFCLQMKIQKTQATHPQVPKPAYLITNLAYHLQLHHKRN